MLCYPNAKINIGLNVVEKRPDGYHNIETIFFPIPMNDALEVVLNKSDNQLYNLSTSGININTPAESNICIKALKLIQEKCDIPPVHVHLHKMIPFGAGLGGGSADGAFMLTLLNNEFDLNIGNDELHYMAGKLGADCPFFIENKPAYATGIGDKLKQVDLDLKGYHLYMVKPPIHVSTPEAYAGVTPAPSSESLKELIKLPVEQWKQYIKNDFESSVFNKYPEIEEIKMKLYEEGAVYASMSGSGSTVFGIFKEKPGVNFKSPYLTWDKAL